MGFPLKDIHGPWGLLGVRAITVDISANDFEDTNGFFVIAGGTGTLRVEWMDALPTDPIDDIACTLGRVLYDGDDKFPVPIPCKKVLANSTVATIKVLYPASGSN